MKDNTDLNNLNNRLYNSVKDLSNIQDEKRELERSPEENAPRILELKSLEESKFDEINQIRSDKAELEPKLESSLGDKLHDLGQDIKEKLGDFTIDRETKQQIGGILMAVDTVISGTGKLYDINEYINQPTTIVEQHETIVKNFNENEQEAPKENPIELDDIPAIEYSTNNENNRTYYSQPLEGANDNSSISPKDGPDGPCGGTAANDNVKPANDNTSLDTLLERYEKDYNKVNFATDSPDKAEEKATDNLLEKLDKQRDPNQENDKQTENGQSKEDKVKDLLKEQYGDKGVEAFERIKEKEREQQPEKQNTQEQTR